MESEVEPKMRASPSWFLQNTIQETQFRSFFHAEITLTRRRKMVIRLQNTLAANGNAFNSFLQNHSHRSTKKRRKWNLKYSKTKQRL